MRQLSSEEVEAFRKNGYLLHNEQLFSAEKFDRLSDIFAEHLADKGEKLSDELDTPHFRDPRLLEFLLADEVLDLVEPLIGPNIALWSSHFISKEPHTGRATPWHEDSAYWEGRLSAYDRIVTVWLSLDGSDRENGCMRVIPGTHSNGFSEYSPVDQSVNTFHAEIVDVDESKGVDFELKPGECSLHDGRIIHGAHANTSSRRRTGYTMRYFPTSVRVYPEKNPGWKIWLGRGADEAGNVYANA
ncbi:phytanoyl-CoA dioxygenase family protein [Phytoactinopolyspora alkaliphila]|uniref:Phytanoyl-CoA dioxygenase family protein n=1 Tax=Phytoactinopolyspora alkaliphila TaxID=1783498 RepID=A0A6N9YLH6_9ACTN|nr:phytanoyl-CoA dioxygenase family protein [Phytoactinopolyspora alkaliphila]NED95876.1 phytanoyl-CoA dioxygenase family protein [Phytoactinopolyspora alkaliphila]